MSSCNEPQSLLSKNDIIDLQRSCYGNIEEVKVNQLGVEVTLKVGSMVPPDRYFDIHKFARNVEESVITKLLGVLEIDRTELNKLLDGHSQSP